MIPYKFFRLEEVWHWWIYPIESLAIFPGHWNSLFG